MCIYHQKSSVIEIVHWTRSTPERTHKPIELDKNVCKHLGATYRLYVSCCPLPITLAVWSSMVGAPIRWFNLGFFAELVHSFCCRTMTPDLTAEVFFLLRFKRVWNAIPLHVLTLNLLLMHFVIIWKLITLAFNYHHRAHMSVRTASDSSFVLP